MASDSESDDDNFFVTTQSTTLTVDSAPEQLQKYLQQPVINTIIALHAYPDLKTLSIKLNTPLAASAACERLFSCAGQIFTPKRSNISDTNFENQVLVKIKFAHDDVTLSTRLKLGAVN